MKKRFRKVLISAGVIAGVAACIFMIWLASTGLIPSWRSNDHWLQEAKLAKIPLTWDEFDKTYALKPEEDGTKFLRRCCDAIANKSWNLQPKTVQNEIKELKELLVTLKGLRAYKSIRLRFGHGNEGSNTILPIEVSYRLDLLQTYAKEMFDAGEPDLAVELLKASAQMSGLLVSDVVGATNESNSMNFAVISIRRANAIVSRTKESRRYGPIIANEYSKIVKQPNMQSWFDSVVIDLLGWSNYELNHGIASFENLRHPRNWDLVWRTSGFARRAAHSDVLRASAIVKKNELLMPNPTFVDYQRAIRVLEKELDKGCKVIRANKHEVMRFLSPTTYYTKQAELKKELNTLQGL